VEEKCPKVSLIFGKAGEMLVHITSKEYQLQTPLYKVIIIVVSNYIPNKNKVKKNE
jgi:hypothetical protein